MPDDPIDLGLLREFFNTKIPFNVLLGLRLEHVERGRVEGILRFREEFIGDPTRPALHGGVLSMMADAVGGAAVWTLVEEGSRVATIDLRVDYLRPGRPEDLCARAQVARVGNRVGVSRVWLGQPGEDDAAVAEATGVYTIKRS